MKKCTLLILMLISINLFAQERLVTGTVTGISDGLSLPGVTVAVKGTTSGTVTNLDGQFTIKVNQGATLVFSFVGFASQEVVVGDISTLNIVLQDQLIGVDEIVVVGYGTQKRSVVTGSISSIRKEDLQNSSVSRAEQALQGKTSGIQVISAGGSPGAGMKIRIRGYSSNGSADPLFIVDGVRTGDINFLNPNDIENIEVLKDGSSAAIYGAEGGNGVVIITTKAGKSGKTTVSYDFQYGQLSVGKTPKLMNSTQYADFMKEAGYIPSAPTDVNTDWMGEIFESSPMVKHNLSFTGGTEKSAFLFSMSYLNQDGILKGNKDKFERYTFRFNSDYKMAKWLKVGHNLAYTYTKRNSVQEDSEFGGLVGSALMIDPTTPVSYSGTVPTHVQTMLTAGNPLLKDGTGNYYGVSNYVKGEIANPFVLSSISNNPTQQHKIIGNGFVEITPMEGLTLTSRLGIDLAYQNMHEYNPVYYYTSERNNPTSTVKDNSDLWNTWQWENFLSYSKSVGQHSFNALVGMSASAYNHRVTNVSAGPLNQDDPSFNEFDYISTNANDRVSGRFDEDKKASYFGRANYDFAGKYLLQASLRRDGASNSILPKSNRWGIFPSFSAGYVLSNESFFPETTYLTYMKIRGGWGRNGSLSNLGGYKYDSYITSSGLTYQQADGTYTSIAEPSALQNLDLKWETSQQTDIGIELRGFSDRLSLTVDYYNKKTIDLITENSPPLESGNKPSPINAGDVVNKGLEFDLGWRDNVAGFKYSVNVNAATLDNEVTYLNPTLARLLGPNVGTGWQATAFEEGQSVWFFRGYKTDGIDAATGFPKFADVSKDGKINADDQTFIGSPIPTLTYGATVNLAYKNFDFTVSLQGQRGNKILMGWIRNDRNTINRPEIFYNDRWTTTNTTASRPGAKSDPDGHTWNSDQLVFDGAFTRIKQIQLGYTLPASLLGKIKLGALRAYVSLEDYFTFTKYPGMDPEAGSTNNNSIGIDRGVYPISKKVVFGLSCSF